MDHPGAAQILGRLLLLFLLILANAFFAMSEIAVISLNDNKVERMAAAGSRKARRVRALMRNSGRFLSMIQIGVTLAGFLASAATAQSFTAPIERFLLGVLPESMDRLAVPVATVLLTLAIAYVSLVLGELVPKRLALKYPEKIALGAAGFLSGCAVLFRPLVWVVSASANGVLRLLGIDPDAAGAPVTEEEIRMLVDAGGETGVIEETQQEMIHNIFELDDLDAGDIMTHRTDIIGVEAGEPLENAVKAAMEEGCSRLPVYEDDLDKIIGVIYIKDLLPYVGRALPGQSPREVMREAHYVPESKRCGELLKEMTASRIQIAVVVDEYGGTAGLVTLEDVLEAIVGSIQDEYDDEEEDISKIDESTFLLEGTTAIEEIEELTGVPLPSGDYDTIAGFVIRQLGYLPQAGERPEVEYEGLKFTVEEVEDRRVAVIKVEIGERPEE
ncbi:MAG: hemolysin family protein [Oscillospiraceae bacterium]|jgi:putative hemolysin|nr:hemolysin family protein [Oscillospiraceae bacterium]